MSISKKKLSYHLTKYMPEIERLIKRKRRRLYFGIYQNGKHGIEDLLQEVLLDLWIRVPAGFDGDKGKLKSYCLTIANHFLTRFAYREADIKERSFISLNERDVDAIRGTDRLSKSIINAIKVPCKKSEILLKVKLEDFAKKNRAMEVVRMIHECEGDRNIARKRLGISNPYITKITKGLKRKGVLTRENLVNENYTRCIANI